MEKLVGGSDFADAFKLFVCDIVDINVVITVAT